MGLLDGILGNVLGQALGGNRTQQAQDPLSSILSGLAGGNSGSGGNPLLQIIMSLVLQNGGLDGLLGKFRQAGMGAQADSWVGQGSNMGIAPNQLEQIFGSSTMSDIASRLGMSQDQAGSAVSQVLPELINQLTPQGQVTEESNQSLSQGLDALTKSLGL